MEEGFNLVEAGLNRIENNLIACFNWVESRLNRVDTRLDIISSGKHQGAVPQYPKD
jgi:hypothetical protein